MSVLSAVSLSPRLKMLGLAAALLAAPISFSQGANAAPAATSPAEAGMKPWPAPVGHRQPNASNVPLEARQGTGLGEDQLEADLDRKLMICRGC